MGFTDERDFFACVRSINDKYLKPADKNIKILEEYKRENGIICVNSLKNAYSLLNKAIRPASIVSDRKKIEMSLKEYKIYLQNFLIEVQWALIYERKKDLQKNISKNDAANIHEEIISKRAELNKIIPEKKDKEDVLDEVIERSKALYDLVETYCAKHNLEKMVSGTVLESLKSGRQYN